MYKIGAIGMGERLGAVIKVMLETEKCELACVADTNEERAKEKIKEWLIKPFNRNDSYLDTIKFYETAEEMLNNEVLDGVCIGTRCSLHAELAELVMKKNIPMFLEKPIATTEDELERIEIALSNNPQMNDKTVVSFPLRLTNLVSLTKEIIESGKLGTISQVQAVNNVPYGRVYYHWWYRDENETQGLWLQKATHDFDYINRILELKPVQLCAMESKQVFKGDMPAGQTCGNCEKMYECPESQYNVKRYAREGTGNMCCFAEDTGNHDSATAIVRYEGGINVVYSQNFVARKKAGKRGARFIGYNGTIEFDFVKKEVCVYWHNEDRCDTYSFGECGSHGGGDERLADDFMNVMGGKASNSKLTDGILSVKMCLAAKKSCNDNQFVEM